MNRASYFLALWLASLVVQTQVVDQAQCQSHADYCRFGIGVNDICPFVDGYNEVDQEEPNGASALAATEPTLDLRGRAVVAVLDVEADDRYDCGYEIVMDDCGSQADDASPIRERDYEQECHQAYLERVKREAEAVAMPTPSPVASTYVDDAYDAYGYGYSYAYEYDYAHRYQSCPQIIAPVVTETPSNEPADSQPAETVNTIDWVARGRAIVASLWESELTSGLQATVDMWRTRAAVVLAKLELARLYEEASQIVVATVRNAVVAGQDWRDANVFVFVFDSDLYAEPLAARGSSALGAATPPADVTTTPQDVRTSDAVTNGDDAAPQVGSLTHEQLAPWVRQVVAAGTEAWQRVSVALRRLAQQSLALAASDDHGSSTHR